MGRCSWWIFLFLCFFGAENHIKSAESQIIKFPQLPRLRWPSFNRPKKDNPVELKPSATNQESTVSHVFVGGPPVGPNSHGGQLGPPPPPPPMPPPPSGLYSSMGYGGPFDPFARPANPFVFPNIMSGPPRPPASSSSYYSSSGGSRKTRRRRPVYDTDSLEDASTEDEPVYIKVKSRKRRPIVIDEEDLMGRGHDGGSSEESADPPKISYKSRTKPQVVYLDSSREYSSPNERRMFIKNDEVVQDAPSYHSPSISALHASVGSGGYQLKSRLASRHPSQPEVVYVNNVDSSPGPDYSFDGSGNHKPFRSAQAQEYPGTHFVVQNIRPVDQQEQQSAKAFFTESSSSSTNAPTIRILLNSANHDPNRQPASTTPDPMHHSHQGQIPSPQSQASMNHFQLFEPTPTLFHNKGFQFGSPSGPSWMAQPPAPPTLSQAANHLDTVKVARRSFSTGNFAPAPPAAKPAPRIVHSSPTQPSLAPPTIFMEKTTRKSSPHHQDQQMETFVPKQSIDFSCSTKRSGYYANRQYKCQVYHQCSKRLLTQTFICPNGTAFNEKQKLCDRIQKVACVLDEGHHRQHNRATLLPTTELPQISSRMDEASGELVSSTMVSTSPTIRSSSETTTVGPLLTKYSTSVSYSHESSSSLPAPAAPTTKA